LLKKSLWLTGLLLVSCTNIGVSDSPRRPPRSQFVAVYFFDGAALAPEYNPLPRAAPQDAIMSLLLDGPSTDGWTTALAPHTLLLSTDEVDERLVLQMSSAFWSGSKEAVRKRAAQIVYSMATLEEGKEVTLLDGFSPGAIAGARGRPLKQPLERGDFADLQPWIQVLQPVAGALVANPIPIRVIVRGHDRASVEVVAGRRVVGRSSSEFVRWKTELDAGEVRISARGHTVVIPIRFGH
jgi:hypothetical protein